MSKAKPEHFHAESDTSVVLIQESLFRIDADVNAPPEKINPPPIGITADGEIPLEEFASPLTPIHYALTPGRSGVLKKPNQAVVMRPMKGHLTVVGRKLWSVMLYYAIEQGIESQAEFDALAIDVYRDAGLHTTNDRAWLMETVQGLNSTNIAWGWGDADNARKSVLGDTWGVTPLVGGTEFYYAPTGHLRMRWAYTPSLLRQLLQKGSFTKLELSDMREFDSLPALALYELANQYLTNPSKVSRRADISTWVLLLRGKPMESYKDLDYTRLRRETLEPATAKVNDVVKGRFEVSFKPLKTGRKVTHLQIEVRGKAGRVELTPNEFSAMDRDLYGRIINLGIHQSEARVAYALAKPAVVREAVRQVEEHIARAARGQQPKINSTMAYLRDRIQKIDLEHPHRLVPGAAASASPSEKSVQQLRAEWMRHWEGTESTRIRSLFTEATDALREEWLSRFRNEELSTLPEKTRTDFEASGLKKPWVSAAFFLWLRKTESAPPDETQLLQHAISHKLVSLPE
ncbi:MAG: replication initiation protein [Nitrospirota bacterium]|nr:replication initiation protein [Nitrospirota bacterium]